MLQIYTLGVLVAGVLDTFLGFIIYFRNRKTLTNILFAAISLSFAVWCYSWVGMLLLPENGYIVDLFARLLNAGAIFLPIFYFHWVLSILNIVQEKKKILTLGYLITVFFSIFSWTNLYIKGTHSILFFPSWPTAGPLYKWYLLLGYFLFVGYGIYLLFKYLSRTIGDKKNQIKYVILVTLMGFGGGAVNFPLMYGINPFGSFSTIGMFVALGFFIPFPILLSYAVIKYRFMDVKVIVTEILTGFAVIVLFIDILLTELFSIPIILLKLGILIVFIYLGISLIRSVLKEVRQREKMEEMAEKVRKAYEVEKKAREELARLGEAKNQFIMASQHHLRTPLTSMRGYLELLLEGHYGKVSPKIKEILERFKLSSERLIKIINEFLDISQFQLGKEVIMPKPGVDLEPILKEIIEELHYETDARGLYLKLEKPTLRQAQGKMPKITADSEKLKIALFNIVDNGIKYTRKGGVAITVKKADAKVQLTVKDTGAGITKEEQEGLFERLFERGKEAGRLHGTGRGIGLYIAYHIIRAHKGKIWVESGGKDKGSTFFIELPVG